MTGARGKKDSSGEEWGTAAKGGGDGDEGGDGGGGGGVMTTLRGVIHPRLPGCGARNRRRDRNYLPT